VPAGSNPEAYDPSPNQLIKLDKSVAYLAVGNLGFELAWLGKLAQNHPELKIFNTSNGISLINSAACSDSHSSAEEHQHIGPDPHIWSSPKTARMMAQNIFNAIASMDSTNRSYYENNLQHLLKEIDSTNIQIEGKLKNIKSRSFLIYHPALTYLARDYNLTQMSVEFNGKEPTPQHLKHLIDIAHQEQIKVIFVQKEFDVKNASILSQEAGCKVVVIDPLSYEWSKGLLEIVNALTHE
jgi:zinc transport system substrate-binding protein